MVNNPLAILWIGRATIYEYREKTDLENCQTTFDLEPIIIDEPCRVSYKRDNTTEVSNGVPYIDQTITLFIRPDLEIKEGSVIEVTQHGRTVKYKRAAKPTIYTQHQEVLLESYEDNA